MDSATPRTDALEHAISERSKNADDIPSAWNGVVSADFARQLERELAERQAAIDELVACKDLHDRIEKSDFATYAGFGAASADYRRRKPLAWSAARALATKV